MAAGRLDGTVTLWNVKTRTPLTHFCYPDQLHKIALSANGQILAAGGIGDTIVLWSVTKGLIHTFSHLTVSPSSTLPVALSPKGTLLVTGSCAKEENGNCKQGQILLWNVVTGQPFGHRLLGHSSDISDVAFSPDERTLAASSEDGIMLWDTVIGNPIMPMLTLSADTHNTKYYDHILFSPDGNRLASYSSPGNVPFSFVVWDVGQHEPLVEKAFQEEDTIQGSVAFNRDGQQLAVVFKRSDSGSIGTFKKWNISIQSWQMVACHIANRNLHRNEWNQFVQGDPYGKVCPDFPLDP